MSYSENYNFWKTDELFNESTRRELSALDPEKDVKEIENRFLQKF